MPENKWNWSAYDAAMQEAGKAPTNTNIENQAIKDVAPFSNEQIIQPTISPTPENKAINSVADVPFQNEVIGRPQEEINQRISNWKNMGVSGDKFDKPDVTGGYTVKGYDTLNNNKEVYVREGEYVKGVSLTPSTSENKAMQDIAGNGGTEKTDTTKTGGETGTKSIDDLIKDYENTYLNALQGDKVNDLQAAASSVFVNDPMESRFVLGEEAGIRAGLESQLAREEAKRKTTLEASKFMLDRLDRQKDAEATTKKNEATIRRKLETEMGYTYIDPANVGNYSESELYRDPNGNIYLKPQTPKLEGTWEVKGNADDGYFMYNSKTGETKNFDPYDGSGFFEISDSYYEVNTSDNTLAVRNNNPGNIKYNGSDWQLALGATDSGERGRRPDGTYEEGTFCKFPDVESGMKAMSQLLNSESYQNRTIDAAMRTWSGSGYGVDDINRVLGTNYPSYMKMSDLTPEQLNDVMLAMQINEGFLKKTTKTTETKEQKEMQKNLDEDIIKAKESLAKGGAWGDNWNLIYDKYHQYGITNEQIDQILNKDKYYSQTGDKTKVKDITNLGVEDKNRITKIADNYLDASKKELDPFGINAFPSNKEKINKFVDEQYNKAVSQVKTEYPYLTDDQIAMLLQKDEWMSNKIK